VPYLFDSRILGYNKKYALAQSYQKRRGKEQRHEVQDALEACVLEGARKMPAIAIELLEGCI
jgi:ABC-type uncharacterized transport system YnjBCD ATPase subunit